MTNICGVKCHKKLNCRERDLDTCAIQCNCMYVTFHLIVAIIQNVSLSYLYYGLENLATYLVTFKGEEGTLSKEM